MNFFYTPEYIRFLRAGYRRMTGSNLIRAFNKKFGLSKTEASVRSALKNRGITNGRGNHAPKGTPRIFSKEQVKFIKRNYRKLCRTDLHRALNKRFGLQATIQQVCCFINNHKIRSGRTGRFEQGGEPWNSGTKGQGLTGRNKTSFKQRNRPANWKPLGSERICPKDGFVSVKVAEINPYNGQPTRYRHKHVVIWEKEHGPVPDGMVVFLIDSDKTNCELENLTMLSRAELLCLNRHGYADLPEELRPSMLALAKLTVAVGEARKR